MYYYHRIKSRKKKAGFTLLELIVVIGIAVALLGLSSNFLADTKDGKSLTASTTALRVMMQQAQQLAINSGRNTRFYFLTKYPTEASAKRNKNLFLRYCNYAQADKEGNFTIFPVKKGISLANDCFVDVANSVFTGDNAVETVANIPGFSQPLQMNYIEFVGVTGAVDSEQKDEQKVLKIMLTEGALIPKDGSYELLPKHTPTIFQGFVVTNNGTFVKVNKYDFEE